MKLPILAFLAAVLTLAACGLYPPANPCAAEPACDPSDPSASCADAGTAPPSECDGGTVSVKGTTLTGSAGGSF